MNLVVEGGRHVVSGPGHGDDSVLAQSAATVPVRIYFPFILRKCLSFQFISYSYPHQSLLPHIAHPNFRLTPFNAPDSVLKMAIISKISRRRHIFHSKKGAIFINTGSRFISISESRRCPGPAHHRGYPVQREQVRKIGTHPFFHRCCLLLILRFFALYTPFRQPTRHTPVLSMATASSPATKPTLSIRSAAL